MQHHVGRQRRDRAVQIAHIYRLPERERHVSSSVRPNVLAGAYARTVSGRRLGGYPEADGVANIARSPAGRPGARGHATADLKVLDLELPHHRPSDRQPTYRQGTNGAGSNGHRPTAAAPTRPLLYRRTLRPAAAKHGGGSGDRRWVFMTGSSSLDNHAVLSSPARTCRPTSEVGGHLAAAPEAAVQGAVGLAAGQAKVEERSDIPISGHELAPCSTSARASSKLRRPRKVGSHPAARPEGRPGRRSGDRRAALERDLGGAAHGASGAVAADHIAGAHLLGPAPTTRTSSSSPPDAVT